MNNNGLSKRSDVMGGQQKHFESGHNWYIIIQNKMIYLVLHMVFEPALSKRFVEIFVLNTKCIS